MAANKYFLGYAFACVVLDHLGGNGPRVVMGPLQRKKVNEAFHKLLLVAGSDGSGLFRKDPQHALIFVVERDLVQLDSLQKDQGGEFGDIKWHHDSLDEQSTIAQYGGLHRIAVLMYLLKEQLDAFDALEKKAANHGSNKEYKNQLEELRTILQEKGKWLIRLYDGARCLFF